MRKPYLIDPGRCDSEMEMIDHQRCANVRRSACSEPSPPKKYIQRLFASHYFI